MKIEEWLNYEQIKQMGLVIEKWYHPVRGNCIVVSTKTKEDLVIIEEHTASSKYFLEIVKAAFESYLEKN